MNRPLVLGLLVPSLLCLGACDDDFDTAVRVVTTGSQVCVEGVSNRTSKCFDSRALPAELAAAPVGACFVVRMSQNVDVLSVRRPCDATEATAS